MFLRNERSIKEFIQLYPIVAWLVIIQVGIWVLTDFIQTPIGTMINSWGTGVNYLISQGEYWRLITAMFLHAGLMHVLFNSFALVIFGPALEQMLGKLKFLVLYIGTGFAGNLATFLLGPDMYAHVGASGALYGLFGIYLFMVIYRKNLIDLGSAKVIKVIVIIGLIMTFLRTGTNVYSHLFGFIGGFALAPVMLKNIRPFNPWVRPTNTDDGSIQFDPDRWHKKQRNKQMMKKGLWIILGILIVLGFATRIF